jgi:peptidyl-prolyl cis-trans isomerase B (cyclophilin B)
MLRFFILILFCLIPFVFGARAQQRPANNEPKKMETPLPSKKANSRPAPAAKSKSVPAEPFEKASVEKMAAQCVKLETEAGIIEIALLPETAPESVRNFLNLAAMGAFDTTTFSRVVPGFVVQGGNISTREKITPELEQRSRRTIPDEPNSVKHERGVVSMARSSEPNSATSHFFILVGDARHLDGTFAAFGRVTSGMEVVDNINKMPVEGDKPTSPVKLKRVVVAACPEQN